jgi:hypothetical protein
LSTDEVRNSGDVPIGSCEIPSLTAGQAFACGVDVAVPRSTMPPGPYFMLGCADDTQRVAESDETNNCRASATTVSITAPDLFVAHAGAESVTVRLGDELAITDTTSNSADADAAAPPTTTAYYLVTDGPREGRPLGGRQVPALTPGESSAAGAAVIVPVARPPGLYSVLACADDPARACEWNSGGSGENNNCLQAGTQVRIVAPDLLEVELGDPPAQASPGSGFDVTDAVLNALTPNPAAADPSTTRYYLSTGGTAKTMLLSVPGGIHGGRDVPALEPGQSSRGTVAALVPADTPPGSYKLMACADDLRAVAEGNAGNTAESNNCVVSSGVIEIIALGSPGLIVDPNPATWFADSFDPIHGTGGSRGAFTFRGAVRGVPPGGVLLSGGASSDDISFVFQVTLEEESRPLIWAGARFLSPLTDVAPVTGAGWIPGAEPDSLADFAAASETGIGVDFAWLILDDRVVAGRSTDLFFISIPAELATTGLTILYNVVERGAGAALLGVTSALVVSGPVDTTSR